MLAIRVISRSLPVRRMFITKGIEDVVDQKRKGDEDRYFNRKDKEALQKLLKKLEKEEKSPEVISKKYQRQYERLMAVLKEHNAHLPPAFIEDLLRWKRGEL